ncbi:MAG: 30S ribosomal protein S9, small subunit ribosomal protein S9 [Candidatus Peregrinibacteria bacterium GW2011_GWC2_39_14]|nr:MAG: 30S ribosomal protein S9 [Candidatus Peregrinibacteria bacterium GW2011_GWA2_38_36]KKR06835.1 MAG: 30S ribosomal protein S9, small subunit ribosomal protein S9 [Candidatus Peregrinibacteria bacterium GW2011_GWC2_39_14]
MPTTKKPSAKPVKKTLESLQTEVAAVEEKPKLKIKSDKGPLYYYANGKRKTSVARVKLFLSGSGNVTVNDRKIEDYFTIAFHHEIIKSPLRLTGHGKTFDIVTVVTGGGINSQAEAIRHGVAKALEEYDESLRLTLKKAGFLTRDCRIKERKKPGLKRARRAPQWNKR